MHRSADERRRKALRSYWLDGLSPGVCNVFIKASKRTVFKRVYGRIALSFLLLFCLFVFLGVFLEAKNSMLQKQLSHFFPPDKPKIK